MGLTNKKEEQLRRMPLMESRFMKSKNGKYLIHQTIITTIRPMQYFEKVIAGEGTIEDVDVQKTLADDVMSVDGADLVNAS